jgi:hypothetical protein
MSQEAEQDQRPEPSVLRSVRGFPGTVLNQRKDRRYFIANPTDEHTSCGMKACLDVGWIRADHRKDKERLHSGSVQDNGDVTWKGQVLLWLPKEKYERIYAEVTQATAELAVRTHGPGGHNGVVDVTGKLATDM